MTTLLSQQPAEGNTYSFSSQPRAVPQRRKYRDQFAQQNVDIQKTANLMYDRRVIRGNTYSQHVLPAVAQPDPVELQRQQEMRRRALARKRARDQLRPKSPEAVDGRKHIDIQTELYLEELADRIEEADVQCQTDAFLDRPPSPLFVPAKSGKDVETQILKDDLFVFDLEVKPILEVLVGKTVEQSLLEVCGEEELANLRSQQRAFQELRNAELVEQQRLEEQDRRHREEKDRRMRQQREVKAKEEETANKIAARAFAQSYLSDLVPSVFGTLAENGYFYDPVERDVEVGFLPWLMSAVNEDLEETIRARTILDGLIRDVVKDRHFSYLALVDRICEQKLAHEAKTAFSESKPKQAASPVPVELSTVEEESSDQKDKSDPPIVEPPKGNPRFAGGDYSDEEDNKLDPPKPESPKPKGNPRFAGGDYSDEEDNKPKDEPKPANPDSPSGNKSEEKPAERKPLPRFAGGDYSDED